LTKKEEKRVMSTRTIYRYSNAFKQKVIGEIESGILSIAEASRIYEISLGGVYNWIRDFGKDCQGAVKVCHSGAVESVPPVKEKKVKFSCNSRGEFSHVKQDQYFE